MLFDVEGVKAKSLDGFLQVLCLNGLPIAFAKDCAQVLNLHHPTTANRQHAGKLLLLDHVHNFANMARVVVVERILCPDIQGHDVRAGREKVD